MRRIAVLMLMLALLGVLGFATSGQGVVRGTVVGEQGKSLSDCEVARGLRLGVGFGGFDGQIFGIGTGGQFVLPVNRGLNRLTVTCRGGWRGTATTVVLRGRDADVAVVLDAP